MKPIVSVVCLLQLLCGCSLVAQNLSPETVFRRYLVSGDSSIAAALIKSDSVYGTYCRAMLTQDQAEKRALFARFVAMKPGAGLADAHMWRGVSFEADNMLDSALAELSTAIALGDGSMYAYYFRGITYLDQKKNAQAAEDFTRSIDIEPKFYLAWHMRGIARMDLDEYEKAGDDFTEAMRLEPRYADPYMMRGMVHEHFGRFDEAIADWEAAARYNPDHASRAEQMINAAREKAAKK